MRVGTFVALQSFVAVCSAGVIKLASVDEVNKYFEDRHNNSQEIDADKILQIICKTRLILLKSGVVSRIQLFKNGAARVTSFGVKARAKPYTFPLPKEHETVYLTWSNGTNHIPWVSMDEVQPPEFRDFKVIKSYYERIDMGFFNMDITWSNPFPNLDAACIVSGYTAAVCQRESLTSASVINLPAWKAINQKVLSLKLFFSDQCMFNLPAIRMSRSDCPKLSSYCKPICVKPDDVSNITGVVVDGNLSLSWLPPLGDSTESVAYGVRWGFTEPGDEQGFPLETTAGVCQPNLARHNTSLSTVIRLRSKLSDKYAVTIQVVGLCEDQALKLSDLVNMTTNTSSKEYMSILKSLFDPAKEGLRIVLRPELEHSSTVEEQGLEQKDLQVISPGKSTNDEIVNGSNERRDIILAVVSGLTVTAVVVVIIAVIYRRRSRDKPAFSDVVRRMRENPFYDRIYVNMADADKWEISPAAIHWGEEVGFGAFGCVYKCVLHEEKAGSSEREGQQQQQRTVAVKKLAGEHDDMAKQQFIQEILVMKELSQHPNILQLIGCMTREPPVCLITEYAPNGDLLSYLHSLRAGGSSIDGSVGSLEYTQLLQMAMDIAVGMDYISSQGCVHRDLAARNLLLDGSLTVKIADFGLARYLHSDDVYVVQNSKRLPVKWLSIEALGLLTFSTASDVWAFGVVLFELVSLGSTPYPTVDPTDMLQYLIRGERMEKPESCEPAIYDMMMECWSATPSLRPSFEELRLRLAQMYSKNSEYDCLDVAVLCASEDIDEGFVPDVVSAAPREALSSESSNYSDVSMIISSPELQRKMSLRPTASCPSDMSQDTSGHIYVTVEDSQHTDQDPTTQSDATVDTNNQSDTTMEPSNQSKLAIQKCYQSDLTRENICQSDLMKKTGGQSDAITVNNEIC